MSSVKLEFTWKHFFLFFFNKAKKDNFKNIVPAVNESKPKMSRKSDADKKTLTVNKHNFRQLVKVEEEMK